MGGVQGRVQLRRPGGAWKACYSPSLTCHRRPAGGAWRLH